MDIISYLENLRKLYLRYRKHVCGLKTWRDSDEIASVLYNNFNENLNDYKLYIAIIAISPVKCDFLQLKVSVSNTFELIKSLYFVQIPWKLKKKLEIIISLTQMNLLFHIRTDYRSRYYLRFREIFDRCRQ